MHVKNHMAMWLLWFLWFLRVEYSAKRLYKPLCAFLVFVDLAWFLCGRICGFWSRVVFGSCLARPIHLLWFWWIGGLSLDADACQWSCASTCPQVLPSMLDADDCASSCSLWVGGFALDARCRRLRVHLPAGLARPLGSPTAKRQRSICKR